MILIFFWINLDLMKEKVQDLIKRKYFDQFKPKVNLNKKYHSKSHLWQMISSRKKMIENIFHPSNNFKCTLYLTQQIDFQVNQLRIIYFFADQSLEDKWWRLDFSYNEKFHFPFRFISILAAYRLANSFKKIFAEDF